MLGFTLPVSESLIQGLFHGALTFNVHQRPRGRHAEHRATFLDPLIEDLHVT